MENACRTAEVGCERTRGCSCQRDKQVRDDVRDRVQPNDEVSVRERKRARNREYNRAYRERKKLKMLSGEIVHLDPAVIERRRACARERVKRYRERKKVKPFVIKGNVASSILLYML
jgi:hypothetical protein